MRRIAAQYLFTGSGPMLRRGVVVLNDEQRVVAIEQLGDEETGSTEFYNGILAPGFVNAHCHLELSYLKGALPQGLGMDGFVKAMMGWSKRDIGDTVAAMREAGAAMYAEGVAAVGDISNTANSFEVKQQSPIAFHSFIEMVGLDGNVAVQKKNEADDLLSQAVERGLSASVTPHAVYSLSDELFEYSVKRANEAGILSIHHQEGAREGSTARQRLLPLLDRQTRLLLVHNTYTVAADIEAVEERTEKAVWVLCPNSNHYIQRILPPAGLLFEKGVTVAIGTDSYASNTRLSMLEEIKTLSTHFPQIPLEVLLQWATQGGAVALNKAGALGVIAPGCRPGLVLIEGVDFAQMRLRPDATARRLGD